MALIIILFYFIYFILIKLNLTENYKKLYIENKKKIIIIKIKIKIVKMKIVYNKEFKLIKYILFFKWIEYFFI